MNSDYLEIQELDTDGNVYLIKDVITGKYYVKKHLSSYNLNVLKLLQNNPIQGVPHIIEIIENEDDLIVIEEFIPGKTIAELIDVNKSFSDKDIIKYLYSLCSILNRLHSFNPPIIHRDIKPSNVILSDTDDIYLIDMDAAKLTTPGQLRDTQLIGTQGFAAPEQYGFGASTIQTDIYGLGQLTHAMITGDLYIPVPKNNKLYKIVEKCLNLNPKDRYLSASQLKYALTATKYKTHIGTCILLLSFILIGFLFLIIPKDTVEVVLNDSSNSAIQTNIDNKLPSQEDSLNDYAQDNNDFKSETNVANSPLGTYSGDYGEKLVIADNGLAYYYCNSIGYTELECPWEENDNTLQISLSKLHCTISAPIKGNNYARIVFKSDSSNWNTEVFNKISNDYESYILDPPPTNSSVIDVQSDGRMAFYIGDIQFIIPKNFVDYGDEYQSHEKKMFTDVDVNNDFAASCLFYEENNINNIDINDNIEELLNAFATKFLLNTNISNIQKYTIAEKASYGCDISGILNKGFSELYNSKVNGKLYIIEDSESHEFIYILQVQKDNPQLNDSELFDLIINNASVV